MTPNEFLIKIESMNLPEDLKEQIRAKLSGDDVNQQDLLDVQELIADSLDADFKEEGIKIDIEGNAEVKEAYDRMNKDLEDAEDEYVQNVATVKVVSDYLEKAAEKVSKGAEVIRQNDLKQEIDAL